MYISQIKYSANVTETKVPLNNNSSAKIETFKDLILLSCEIHKYAQFHHRCDTECLAACVHRILAHCIIPHYDLDVPHKYNKANLTK